MLSPIGSAMQRICVFFAIVCVGGLLLGQPESAAIAGIISVVSFVGGFLFKL